MKLKTEPFSASNFAIQSWLRPALTPVGTNCDYDRFLVDLERIDANIRASCVEALALELALEDVPSHAHHRPHIAHHQPPNLHAED